MKKALVLGANGGMGYALVNELASRGIKTVAFSRNENKLKTLYSKQENVQLAAGDAFVLDDIVNIPEIADVDVIFHTVSIPYPKWTDGHPQIMETAIQATKQLDAKLVVIDNIYAYGKPSKNPVTEECPKNPHTKKGNIRLKIDQMGKEAHANGTPVMFIHYPDFYGPNASNTMLNQTIEPIAKNKSAIFVGKQDKKREFIYTPDGAKAAVELASREECYGENWNIPGYGVISGQEIIKILKEITGYKKRVNTVGKGFISLAGLFSKDMKEIVEMLYLTEEPVVLSGSKYESRVGEVPKTSYREGLEACISFIKTR